MTQENAEVNWIGLMEDYNAVIKTDFKDPREMLKFVYAEQKTYKKTGKVFLLTSPTIAKYMKKWGLKCLPSGHRGDPPCLRAIKSLGDVSSMNTKQIARQINFSCARVTTLLRIHNINYKHLRKIGKS